MITLTSYTVETITVITVYLSYIISDEQIFFLQQFKLVAHLATYLFS